MDVTPLLRFEQPEGWEVAKGSREKGKLGKATCKPKKATRRRKQELWNRSHGKKPSQIRQPPSEPNRPNPHRGTHLKPPSNLNYELSSNFQILQNINQGIRLEEDERRKREAELKLYHQWRNSNPILRDHERAQSAKDLKLSWLDQQIERRVAKERAEEECRKHLAERERRLEAIKHQEEQLEKDTTSRNLQLKHDIERQMEQLKSKLRESDDLRHEEKLAAQKLSELLAIGEQQKAEEKRRSEKECALFNIRQHKMKLKQQAADVQENLKQEQELVEQLQSLQIVERIQDEQKKREINAAMGEFLEFTKQQQALEKQRQKHMDLVFDSESQAMYERQRAVWQEEQKSRQELLGSVLDILQRQMDEKLESNKVRQKEVLEERERMLQLMEDYAEEAKLNEREQTNKTAEWKAEVEQQLKEKAELKERERRLEEGDVERQLQSARKEEERIKQEIVNLQRKEGVYRRPSSRILY